MMNRALRLASCALAASLSAHAFAQCDTIEFAGVTGSPSAGGTLLPGSQGDDVAVTNLSAPFPLRIYSASSTTYSVSSNGVLELGPTIDTAFTIGPVPHAKFGAAVMPFWCDLITTNSGEGIFTQTTGTAPNRRFEVRWKGRVLATGSSVNFSVAFNESNTVPFEFIYANAGDPAGNGGSASIGAQLSPSSPSASLGYLNAFAVQPNLKFLATCTSARFYYQGRIDQNGQPSPGPHQVSAILVNSQGIQQGQGLVFPGIGAPDGTFTLPLSFSNASLAQAPLFLRLTVNGTILTPDQPIQTAPRAAYAERAANVDWKGIYNLPNSLKNFTDTSVMTVTGSGVGIGVNSPSTPLDVIGTVRASSFAYNAPVTSQFMLIDSDFRARNGGAVTFGLGNGGASPPSADFAGLSAPIHLPHGAQVTAVRVYFVDNDSTRNLNLSFGQFSPATGFGGSTDVPTSGFNNNIRFVDLPVGTNYTVDNANSTLYLGAYPITNAGGTATWGTAMFVMGARITYTVTQPVP